MEDGICPDNRFSSKANICSCWNFPKEVGMELVNRLACMPKTIKLLRFSNVAGNRSGYLIDSKVEFSELG